MTSTKMDRLLLPRVRLEPEGVEHPIPEAGSPLPRWQTLPMDAKFPVDPAPRGEVTFVTTKMCQPAYRSSQREDFDLTDPYNRTIKSEYKSLYDPFLKGWFSRPHVRQRLVEQNLITEKGNIPCSVRDFNDYRYFLRQQAVIKNKHADTAPLERRQHVIQQKKLKAEVFGVEVKYKLLKARQTSKEEEEEKRKKYEEKQQQETERMRLFEERKQGQLTRSKNKVTDKIEEIKRREAAMRRKAEEKLIQFESEAQRRLNIIDYIREQKFYEQDQKRKEAWRKKREHQTKVMVNTERLKRKVETEMRLEKRRYEEGMVKRLVKDKVGFINRREDRERAKSDMNEAFAKRMTYALEGTKQKTIWDTKARPPPTRRASMWMVEEVLHRLGLYNKYKEFKSEEWSHMLEGLISSTVRKMETASVIGEEQELLSNIIHILLRRLKEAYPAPTGQDNLPDVDAVEEKEQADKRLFPDLDASLETEHAIRISMMTTTLDLEASSDQHIALGGNWVVPSEATGELDKHEEFFARKMRVGETDAFAIEKELTQFLDYLKDENMSVKDMKAIVLTILKLANHESITLPDPCGPTERNPDGRKVYAFDGLSSESLWGDSSNKLLQKFGSVSESRKASVASDKRASLVSEFVNRSLPTAPATVDDPNFPLTDATAAPGWSELPEITDAAPGATEAPEMTDVPEVKEAPGEAEAPGDTEVPEETDVSEVTGLSNGPEVKALTEAAEVIEAEEYSVPTDEESSKLFSENVPEDVSESQGSTENDALESVTVEKALDNEKEGSLDDNQNKETEDSKAEDMTEDGNKSREEGDDNDDDDSIEERKGDKGGEGNEEDDVGPITLDNEEVVAGDNEDGTAADNEDGAAADNEDGAIPETEEDKALDETSPGAQEGTAPTPAEDREDGQADAKSPLQWTNQEKTSSNKSMTGRLDGDDGSKDPYIAGMESLVKPRWRNSSMLEESEDLFGTDPPPDNMESESESEHTKMMRAEMEEEKRFTELVEMDDIPAVTQHFLHKIQERGRLQGVCFPPSRYHRFIAMTLSKIWGIGAGVKEHTFGSWLSEPEVGDVAKSSPMKASFQNGPRHAAPTFAPGFLYNMRRRRLPPDLLRNIATSMTAALMHDVTESPVYWSDALVRTILEKFHKDLQNESVTIGVIERVLKQVLEEYMDYEEMHPDFKIENFLVDIMEKAYELSSQGLIKRSQFLEAIYEYKELPKERQELLYCSNWTNLLHRSLVTIQLRILTPDVKKNLRDVVINCGVVLLEVDKDDDVNECMERIKTRMADPVFKRSAVITYSANTVVQLIDLADECRIGSSMLLPGALNVSHSALRGPAVYKLGPETLGECVVVLMMDQLAQKVGTDTLKPKMAEHLAASLVELLVSDYRYERSSLQGRGLKEAFDTIAARLRFKELNFAACKKILGCLLRSYLATSVKQSSGMENMVQPLTAVTLDPEQMIGFLDLVSQAYFTFVATVVLKVASSELKVDEPDDIQILYVWRSIAQLAKEGRLVIKEFLTTKPITANYLVLKSDSTTVQRMAYTVMGEQADAAQSKEHGEDDYSSLDNAKRPKITDIFLKSVLGSVRKVGYVPVKDNYPSFRKSREDEEPMDLEDELRSRPTPDSIEAVLRKELIFSFKDIGDMLVTPESLKRLAPKLADYLASTVFILDRFVLLLYEKLWDARYALVKKKITPRDLQNYVIGENSDCLSPLQLTHDEATQLVTRAIFELESVKASMTTLAKMAESLSRIGLDNGGVRGQPHVVLSCVPPHLVTQLARACMLTTLRTLTAVLKGSFDRTIWSPLRMSVYNDEQKYLISAYVIVHNILSAIRNGVEEEKNHQGLWTPKGVAGTKEDSVLMLPIEVIDKVFARIGGVLDTLTESPDKDHEDDVSYQNSRTSSPTVVAENVINCVMNSVVYRVEIGEFPFIRINDLLRSDTTARPKDEKTPQPGSTMASYNVSDNKKKDFTNNSLINPLLKIEQDVSRSILNHIGVVFASIHQQLKDDVDAALVMNAGYEAELEARVFIDVILGKVRSHAKRKDIRFFNCPHVVDKGDHFDDPFAPVQAFGGQHCVNPSLRTASFTSAEPISSIASYISGLFERIVDEKKQEGDDLEKTANLIRSIIKACLAADHKFVSPKGQGKDGLLVAQISRSDAVCVLVVEIVLNELFDRLRWCKKCAEESLFKKTSHPYLCSRTFKEPDPLGPYYAEVMDRERRLSNFINVETTTCVSKMAHGRQGSSIRIDSSCKGESSVRTKPSSSCQSDRHKAERSRGTDADVMTSKKIISRVSEWRRNIQATSAANSLDTTKSSSSLWRPKQSKRLSQMNVSQNKVTKADVKTKSGVKPIGKTVKPVGRVPKEGHLSGVQNSKPSQVPRRGAVVKPVKESQAASKQRPTQAPPKKVSKTEKPLKKSTRGKVKDWMVSPGLHQERIVEVIYHRPVAKSQGGGEKIPEKSNAATVEDCELVRDDGDTDDDYSSDENNESEGAAEVEASHVDKEEEGEECDEGAGAPMDCAVPGEGQTGSRLLRSLLMSLLSEEIPDVTGLVYKCFTVAELGELSAGDVARLLSCLDLAKGKLELGDVGEAEGLLSGQVQMSVASERLVGAATSVFKYIEGGMLTKEVLWDRIQQLAGNDNTLSNMDADSLKGQLSAVTQELVLALSDVEGCPPTIVVEKCLEILEAMQQHEQPITHDKTEGGGASDPPMATPYDDDYDDDREEPSEEECNDQDNDSDDDDSKEEEEEEGGVNADTGDAGVAREAQSQESAEQAPPTHAHEDKMDTGCSQSSSWSSLASSLSSMSRSTRLSSRNSGHKSTNRSGSREEVQISHRSDQSSKSSRHSVVAQDERSRTSSRSSRSSSANTRSSRSSPQSNRADTPDNRPAAAAAGEAEPPSVGEVGGGADQHGGGGGGVVQHGGGGGVVQPPLQTTNRCRNTLGLDRVDHELAKICELPLPCLDPEMRLIDVARGLDPDDAAWMDDTPEPRYDEDEDEDEMDEAEEEDYYNELDDYGETDEAASSTDRSGRGEDTGRGEGAGRGEGDGRGEDNGRGEDEGCDGDSGRGEEDEAGDEDGRDEYDGRGDRDGRDSESDRSGDSETENEESDGMYAPQE